MRNAAASIKTTTTTNRRDRVRAVRAAFGAFVIKRDHHDRHTSAKGFGATRKEISSQKPLAWNSGGNGCEKQNHDAQDATHYQQLAFAPLQTFQLRRFFAAPHQQICSVKGWHDAPLQQHARNQHPQDGNVLEKYSASPVIRELEQAIVMWIL